MNYESIYNSLINKFAHHNRDSARELYGYSEAHHIIPRCMGGLDEKSNIVHLPAKAHFIAHYLLVKMYPNSFALWSAFNLMAGQSSKQHLRDYYKSAKVYELCKINLSRIGISKETRVKIGKAKKGVKLTEEHVRNMIAARIGSKRPEVTKERMRAAHKKRAETHIVSEETRAKMREKKIGRTLTEEHKQKIGRPGQKKSEETKLRMKEAWVRRKMKT